MEKGRKNCGGTAAAACIYHIRSIKVRYICVMQTFFTACFRHNDKMKIYK